MKFKNQFYGFLPYLVFSVGVISSIILWKYFRQSNVDREREHLALVGQEIRDVILNRMKTYEDSHKSGAALYHTIGDINGQTWKKWVESTKILDLYPGIYGIGVALRVKKEDSLAFLKRVKKEDPDFSIKRLRNLQSNDMFIIRYIEPMERNWPAYGYDMGSEINRRSAMEKSRLTGRSQITKKVVLVQDESKSPGFLLYVPVYQTSDIPPEHLRDSMFRGWIYSPFIAQNFAEGIVKRELRNTSKYVSFDLFSDSIQTSKTLFYSFRAPGDMDEREVVTVSFPLYGQTWSLRVFPGEVLRKQYLTRQPLIILLTGIFLSLIMSGFVYLLANTHKKAIDIAETMTHELNELNVTLERKVEDRTQKLQEINWFYENLIQSMQEGLLVLDRNFRIIKGNSRFFQLFKADRVIEGLELTELTNVEWTPVLKDVMQSFRSNEMFEREYMFELPGSGTKYFSITSIPLKQRVMSDQKVLLVISDVTDKKENEQRRNDFIGFVTHELRTPLSNLKAYAQLSERFFKQNKPEESYKLSKKILQFIDRLSELVSELHDVTKVSSGKLQMIKDAVVYDDFITETIEEAVLTYPDFRFIRRGMSHVTVRADRYRLNQVLTNYISNAVKYSTDRKEIIVSVHVEEGSVVTSVKDFGSGIPEENIPKIFERLYRVQKHAKTEGLGLGLYLSREIIKAHGGKVWVESEEQKGSEFFYSIPYDNKIQVDTRSREG